jgi:hypothetical protein
MNKLRINILVENVITNQALAADIATIRAIVPVKQQQNPWAICNAKAKEHNWDKAKTERCVKRVKQRIGSGK